VVASAKASKSRFGGGRSSGLTLHARLTIHAPTIVRTSESLATVAEVESMMLSIAAQVSRSSSLITGGNGRTIGRCFVFGKRVFEPRSLLGGDWVSGSGARPMRVGIEGHFRCCCKASTAAGAGQSSARTSPLIVAVVCSTTFPSYHLGKWKSR
jgi:hypothetical protein